MASGSWPGAIRWASGLSPGGVIDWTQRYPLVAEAVNHLKVRLCLIDGEVVCWRTGPGHLPVPSTSAERAASVPPVGAETGRTCCASRSRCARRPWRASCARAGRCPSKRAHGAPGGRRPVPACVQDRAGGARVAAAGIALPIWALSRLVELKESGSTGG